MPQNEGEFCSSLLECGRLSWMVGVVPYPSSDEGEQFRENRPLRFDNPLRGQTTKLARLVSRVLFVGIFGGYGGYSAGIHGVEVRP